MQKSNDSNSTGNAEQKIPFLNDPKIRSIIYQIVTIGMVGLLGYYLFTNTVENLNRQSIATGFGFFEKESSFEIGESLIPYSVCRYIWKGPVCGYFEHNQGCLHRHCDYGYTGNFSGNCPPF